MTDFEQDSYPVEPSTTMDRIVKRDRLLTSKMDIVHALTQLDPVENQTPSDKLIAGQRLLVELNKEKVIK